jgi:hypothetical protein
MKKISLITLMVILNSNFVFSKEDRPMLDWRQNLRDKKYEVYNHKNLTREVLSIRDKKENEEEGCN